MEIYETLSRLLGLDTEPRSMSFTQMSLRAIVVFIFAVVLMRIANKRFLSRMSSLDAVLGFILASVLARAVNGSAAFFPTLGCSFVLVMLHRVLAQLGFYSPFVERWTKGRSNALVKHGKTDPAVLRRYRITENDLMEELRLNGQVSELANVETATLERNGNISIISRD